MRALLQRVVAHLLGPFVGGAYELYLWGRDLWRRAAAGLAGRSLVIDTPGQSSEKLVALIASQANGRVPKSVHVAIDLLHARGAAILLVCNGRLNAATRDQLAPKLWRVLQRPNYGRDFGAYKCGVMHLMRQRLTPRRLIVLNDSMFYDHKRAGPMFDRLIAAEHPFLAATENHEPHFHVGSFLFCVDDAVQRSGAWRRYWRNYQPSSSRPHAIWKGELGFSHAMIKKGGFFPRVLYSTNDIAAWLRGWNYEDLARQLHLLPKGLREEVRKAQLGAQVHDGVLISSDAIASALNQDPGEALTRLQSTETRAVRRLPLSQVLDGLLSAMEARSQIHWAGALFVQRLGLGMMKKDFAYRDLYDIGETYQMMQELGYDDMEEVSLELRQRGSPVSLRGLKRILYHLGHL